MRQCRVELSGIKRSVCLRAECYGWCLGEGPSPPSLSTSPRVAGWWWESSVILLDASLPWPHAPSILTQAPAVNTAQDNVGLLPWISLKTVLDAGRMPRLCFPLVNLLYLVCFHYSHSHCSPIWRASGFIHTRCDCFVVLNVLGRSNHRGMALVWSKHSHINNLFLSYHTCDRWVNRLLDIWNLFLPEVIRCRKVV